MQKKQNYLIGGALAALTLYGASGFWGVPEGIRWALTKYADPLLGRTLTAEEIHFNPFTLRLNVKGFKIVNPDDSHEFIRLKELDTALSWSSLWRLSPIISHLTLDGFDADIIRTGLTEFNFSDIIENVGKGLEPKEGEAPSEKSENSKPLRFAVSNAVIRNSSVTFDDKFRSRTDRITDLDFAMPLISNFVKEVENPITPKLSFNFNGKPIEVDAKSIPFTLSKRTGVDFTLTGLPIENLASFNPVPLNIKVEDGTLDARLNLAFREADPEYSRVRRLRLAGVITLNDVVINDTLSEPYAVTSFKKLEIDIDSFAFFINTVKLHKITLTEPVVNVIRKGEKLNLSELAANLIKKDASPVAEPAPLPAETSEVTAEEATPWSWSLDEFEIRQGDVRFNDMGANFAQNIGNLNFFMSNLSGEENTEADFSGNFAVLEGTSSFKGRIGLDPLKFSLATEEKDLNLALLQPYVRQYSHASLTSGRFEHTGQVEFAISNDTPIVHYNGAASVTNLKAADPAGREFASLNALRSEGIDVRFDKALNLAVTSVTADTPRIRIIKDANGTVNIASLSKDAGTTKKKSAAQKSKQNGTVAVTLGKASVTKGSVLYQDNSMSAAATTRINGITASLKNFSTLKNKPATIAASCTVNDTKTVVSGQVNPFNSNIKLNVEGGLKALSLHSFSPYSAAFTGYPIKQGLLSYQGNYDIRNDKLKSENTLEISKLEFGNVSPDAEKVIPMPLAVSLLQNTSGIIDLKIPVSGSLNDPEFTVSGVIVKVIVNLVTKAVTAPFALIGSVFGGVDVDLSSIPFDSGYASLNDENTKALDIIAKAMQERPGFKIRMTGIANLEGDETGLRERILMRNIRSELHIAPGKPISGKQMESAINRLFRMADDTGKPDGNDAAVKREFLLKQVRITPEDLQRLASARANLLRNYLMNEKKIAPERLFLAAPDENQMQTLKAGVRLDIEP